MAAALNENAKTFVVHVAAMSASTMPIYFFHQAQIGLLLANKASIKVPPKFLDYADFFLFDFAIDLPENTNINEHVIKLVEDKQLPHDPI